MATNSVRCKYVLRKGNVCRRTIFVHPCFEIIIFFLFFFNVVEVKQYASVISDQAYQTYYRHPLMSNNYKFNKSVSVHFTGCTAWTTDGHLLATCYVGAIICIDTKIRLKRRASPVSNSNLPAGSEGLNVKGGGSCV